MFISVHVCVKVPRQQKEGEAKLKQLTGHDSCTAFVERRAQVTRRQHSEATTTTTNRTTTQQKQQNIKAKELRFAFTLALFLSLLLTSSLFSLETLSVV